MERDWVRPVTALSANAVLRHTETLPNLQRSASDTSLIGVKSGHSRLVLHWLRMLIKFAFVSRDVIKKAKKLTMLLSKQTIFYHRTSAFKSISCQLPNARHHKNSFLWENDKICKWSQKSHLKRVIIPDVMVMHLTNGWPLAFSLARSISGILYIFLSIWGRLSDLPREVFSCLASNKLISNAFGSHLS